MPGSPLIQTTVLSLARDSAVSGVMGISALVLASTYVSDRSRGEIKQQDIYYVGLKVHIDIKHKTGVLNENNCLLSPSSDLFMADAEVWPGASAVSQHSRPAHSAAVRRTRGREKSWTKRPGLMTRDHMVQANTEVTIRHNINANQIKSFIISSFQVHPGPGAASEEREGGAEPVLVSSVRSRGDIL